MLSSLWFCRLAVLAALLSPALALGQTYSRELHMERQEQDKQRAFERIVSGSAALAIGLYGYYNDDRGAVVRLTYSATQTAGVYMLSSAIASYYEPSLLLTLHDELRTRRNLRFNRFRKIYMDIQNRRRKGALVQRLVTSSVLSAVYVYSGYREAGNESTLRNVYYFLGFNMLAVAGASAYQYLSTDIGEHAQIELFPTPTLTVRF